jgi:hypothetical protein
MNRTFPLLAALLIFLLAGQAGATSIRAEASPLLLPGLIEVNQPFTVDIYLNNTDAEQYGYSMSFVFYSPDQSIANVVHRNVHGYSGKTIEVPPVSYEDSSILLVNNFETLWDLMNDFWAWSWDGTLPDTINHTTATMGAWPVEWGDMMGIQYAFISNTEGNFCIDSCTIPNVSPPGKYDWLFMYPVTFNGPYCWEIGTMPEDPEIGVSLDSIFFEIVEGEAPPPAQVMQISNTAVGTLNWTASWNSTWLSVSPSFGSATPTTPSTVQVYANNAGLTAGTYKDTITISDPNATNDPVRIPVKFAVHEPPPRICLSETSFHFVAIADSANPDDQVLTITNCGGGTLDWQAGNLKSWLSLFPTSGTDSVDVTLSVDITGMSYGVYYDTVTVSDPDASNDPQKAFVSLEIVSGLPLIGLDPDYIYVAVDTADIFPDDREFTIFNAGAGTMNYYLEEFSDRILSLTPESGAAPQTVTIQFDSIPGSAGQNFFDSIWVYSDEAINSPQLLIIQFHLSADPARIVINKESIVHDLYECSQGLFPPPLPKFTVYNASGTETFTFEMNWSSEWLLPDPTGGPEPQTITVNFDYYGMAPGTYRDTIIVTAVNAINSPQSIPITLNILPTDMAPQITASKNRFTLTAQENKGGTAGIFMVNNYNPGCMEWEFQESIPWLTSAVDTFTMRYPWFVGLMSNAAGMVMGEYHDTALIVSPTASNSPYPIAIAFWVWRFHGDCDFNGVINMLDIIYLIDYLYKVGPAPIPTIQVGDCNCDSYVDMLDVILIMDYLFRQGPPLCGNPY